MVEREIIENVTSLFDEDERNKWDLDLTIAE